MPMQLMSEYLLKKEIDRIEKDGNEKGNMAYALCKKELVLIQKMKIEKLDMTGNDGEFRKRLENNGIYFMEPSVFEEMNEKARRYDKISTIIQNQTTMP